VWDGPWRVGILDETGGALCGAGVLVSDRHILTCAHVIATTDTDEPRSDIRVQLVGMPGQPTITARVRDGCWQPERPNDHCADVALLELDDADAVRDTTPARLRQMRLIGRHAQAQGYPRGISTEAEWAQTIIVGPTGPDSEWMQMDPLLPTSAAVRHGFSGAGVVDLKSGDVVGIVVAKQSAADSKFSYLIPVDTIARHLPEIGPLIHGEPPADVVFVLTGKQRIDDLTSSDRRSDTDNGVLRAIRVLVAALRSDGRGGVWNVVGPAEDRLAVLRTMVVLADPSSRLRGSEAAAAVPADLVLPAGRIDLALDARGRTTGEMAGRILERLGMPTDEPDAVEQAVTAGAALIVVIDSLDDAVDSDRLRRELVGPMARAAPDLGGQLIVGSQREVLADHGGTPLPVGSDRARTVAHQVDELSSVVAEIDAHVRLSHERHTNNGAPKFRSAPVVASPHKLRVRVTAFRGASGGRYDDPRVPEMLAVLRRAADTELRAAALTFDQLEAMLRDRDKQRGALQSYKVRAAEAGYPEDPELSRRYETADRLLYTAPCDLIAAAAAVDAYLRAVRRRLGIDDEDHS
jgi:V8-like Glu-specific endopeptidase